MVFNAGVSNTPASAMTPEESKLLIVAAGGDVAFARRIGLAEQSFSQQRVNNWRRRGIPASVVLSHYDKIAELQKEVAGDR